MATQNAHNSPIFKHYPNEKAKLKNAWVMLNWYAYRFAVKNNINVTHPIMTIGVTVTPTTTIQELSDIWHGKTPVLITDEIAAIIRLSWKFKTVTPDGADSFCRHVWTFLTNYNDKLTDVPKIATPIEPGKFVHSGAQDTARDIRVRLRMPAAG
jgi:hypothetical protein